MKFATFISRLVVLTTAAVGAWGRSADQLSTAQYDSFAASIEGPVGDSGFFRDRFDAAFQSDVNDVFVDALSPQNVIQWNLQLPGRNLSQRFHDRVNSAANSAFVNSFKYSGREAFIGTPFVLWLDGHEGWFGDLISDTVGNTGEESISSLDPSYRVAQQSWWSSLSREGGTYLGLRPISTSPYAYVSHAFRSGGQTLLLANVRYYYDRFSNHRFELALSLPLSYGWSIDAGSAYEFGQQNNRRVAVQLVKQFTRWSAAHVGFQVQEHPTVIAGITVTW